MAIGTKESSQDKASDRVDRSFRKPKRPKKEKPLLEREFNELITLKDQLEWVELKKKQREKELFQNLNKPNDKPKK